MAPFLQMPAGAFPIFCYYELLMASALRILLLLLLGLPCLVAPAVGQEALVLSGGGSRGLAHAGVFEALEELGYDPDIVIGTSMGAVVGALYAAGYEPEVIRRRLLEVQWADLFQSTPTVIGPLRDVRYPLLTLDLDVARLRFSRGFLGQWRINRVLARLLFDANARSRGDFDRLARRYRAVATDLRTGEAVVLSSGDIARAARASMAVPGFFAPVTWQDRTLIDGGISDNLPTSVARRLGAQRVIAVDVSRPSDEIHSHAPLAIIGRALDLLQENTQRDSIPPHRLVLPEISPGVSGATFPEDPTGLYEAGLSAGRRDLGPADAPAGRGARPLPVPPDSFSELVVEAPDSALADLARRIFAGVAPGPYDAEAVGAAVDRLYSTGLLEGVWPMVTERAGAAPALMLRLEAPPRLSLSTAAAYDNDLGGRAWASLDRFQALGRRPLVLSAAASLGGLERWGSASMRVYPLSRAAITWSVGAHVMERDVRFFPEDGLGEKQVLRAGGWLSLERPYILRDRVATVSVPLEVINVEEGASGLAAGIRARFSAIDADPRLLGLPLLVELERRWGGVTYTRGSLSASRGFGFGPIALSGLADARGASGDAPPDVLPALGDEHAVPGFRWGEVRGAARIVGGVDGAVRMLGGHARVRLRTGGVAADWQEWEGSEWHVGGQIAGVWQSAIGAVEAGYGLNSRGDGRFDIRIGRSF